MPVRAIDRRDPQKGQNGISTKKGFTLIELMIVIGVLAVITSLALPSYRTIIEKRQVTSGAEQLGAFLSAVQMESVKRSENLTVTYSRASKSSWCIGVVSGTTACTCTITDPTAVGACAIDGQLRVTSDADLNFPGIMSGMDGDGAFVFDPARGLIYDDAGLSAFDEAELELVSENATYGLNVQITRTGRIQICSDSDDKKVPRFETCARDIL